MTPHTTNQPRRVRGPSPGDWGISVMGAKPDPSRTGLVRIRDVGTFPGPMAIAQRGFLLPRQVQENSSARGLLVGERWCGAVARESARAPTAVSPRVSPSPAGEVSHASDLPPSSQPRASRAVLFGEQRKGMVL